ncbi:MAG: FkbM family methyltransferase [Betaproteobacteria bacterium]|nr:FkbM family methyltransferase [Betaproteobacteria bacterium]
MTMAEYRNTLTQGAGIVSAIWHHPANHGRRFRAVLQSLGWQVSKHTLKRPRIIDFHGRKLKCFPDSTSTSAALYFNGLAGLLGNEVHAGLPKTRDHFMDVGANVGVYSILAASRVGDFGSIDAFEPMEDTAQRIEEQAELNNLKNLRVHRLAVGECNGQVDFGFSNSDAMRHIKRQTESASNGIRVKSIRLDDFQPNKDFSMGKMDIEGAEPLALRGSATPYVMPIRLYGFWSWRDTQPITE